MVYLYKKIVEKKPYYYLRVSERKGNKVIAKDIAYLGNSLDEVKKALESKKYKERIRKTYKTIRNFLESNLWLEKVKEMKLKKDLFLGEKLEEVEACKLHYNSVFQKKDALTKKEIMNGFLVEFAYNTTSIEGNTITLEQTRNLLEEGLTPENKTLREIYDLQNTERVFFEIFGSNAEINHEFIMEVHDKLLENIDMRKGYRKSDIHVVKSRFEATPAPYIITDMNLLLKWYNQNKEKLHPLALASIFHHKFERIHPFFDGNGRTGRMLMNYILIKRGYPPIILHKKTREDYLSALGKADDSGLTQADKEHYSALIQYASDELIHSYWELFL